MNEVQLKYELIKLEKKILDITGDPIDYKHYSPSWTGAVTMRKSRWSRK